MNRLTPKQMAMYQFIRQFIAREGIAPTLQQIADGFGTKSRGVVHRTLQRLQEKGYLEIEPGKKRGIKLVDSLIVPSSLLPVAGEIMAGPPTQPIEKQAMLDVSELLINEKLQVLKIVGECKYLSKFNINVGDYVICEHCLEVPSDQLTVAVVNSKDFIIGTINKNSDQTLSLKLLSGPELRVNESDVEIKGKYMGLIRLNEGS